LPSVSGLIYIAYSITRPNIIKYKVDTTARGKNNMFSTPSSSKMVNRYSTRKVERKVAEQEKFDKFSKRVCRMVERVHEIQDAE
jgi:hypothetical protein